MTDHEDDDHARSMRDEAVRQRRRAKLSEPHITRLTAYAAKLRGFGKGEVPDFDPLDGGDNARALFLFEKPGPKTSEAQGGSGFISRNNISKLSVSHCLRPPIHRL